MLRAPNYDTINRGKGDVDGTDERRRLQRTGARHSVR